MALTKVQTIGIETGITFTGITTTSSLQATEINVSGIATFGGNVSIAGTLTYEDVTDIDSVGLITARSGVNITDGGLVVVGVTTVSAGSTSAPSITPSGDPDTGIFFPSADTIAFGEGGAEAARIDSSGRLLVGTNTTSATCTAIVQGSSAGATSGGSIILARGQAPADGSAIGSIFFAANNHVQASRISSARDGGTWTAGSSQPSRLEFATTADGASSPTERMRIDSSGRVGIGTASPTGELHIQSSAGSNVVIQSGGTSDARIDFIPGGETNPYYVYVNSSRNLIFTDHDTERARIDSSGRLLVGTTTARAHGAYTPAIQLESVTANDNASLAITRNGNNPSGPLIFLGKTRSGSLNGNVIVQSGDLLGGVVFSGADGSDLASQAASILSYVDGTPGSNDMPGRLVFSTTADGASSPTERMRILSTGEVRITGTMEDDANNAYNLTILGNDSGTNGESAQFFLSALNSNSRGAVIAAELQSTSNNHDMLFKVSSPGASPTERMRINSSGHLGIGTSSPSGRLDVRRDVNGDNPIFFRNMDTTSSSSAMTTTLSFNFNRTGGSLDLPAAQIRAGKEREWTGAATNQDGFLSFFTTGDETSAERMRITSGGSLFVATTTSTKTSTGFRVENGVPNTSRGTSGSFMEFFHTGSGSRIGFISNNGGTSTAYNTTSDYRLKENVVPLTGAVDRLNQLQVRRFNFIATPNLTVDGFIAHEAQAVVPEAVTGTHNEVDDENNPVYQGIDQSKLVPLLTAALQEALAEIESLKARVTALEP